MPLLQSLFIIVVILVLAYLLLDGWFSGAVWVKGARKGLFDYRRPAHRRDRDADPWIYWFAMGFYLVVLLCLVALLLSGQAP